MSAYVRLAIFVTCIAILAGCSRERRDWQSAQTADTIEAYGDFLAKHGDSPLAAQAETRVKQLGEERDWQQAATTDTLEAYQAYLRQHPESKWAEEARIRVENFSLAGATPGAPMASGPAAPPAVASPATTVPPIPAAPPVQSAPRPATPSSRTFEHGIQLGAFSTEAKAHAEWERVARAHGSVLAGLSPAVVAVKSGGSTLYRLRAATGGEAKSRSLCEALRSKGQACVVVLPVGK
ncbi:MAG TPA: SPOR domain-containing protein [Steroidobacteraceae bacterium]|nr:SPOR domain-containing protein [Steroidobacteraceae bacterium]HQX77796.1 SPOR domain-containing protein [Steroidobacteraceae bacterium]HQZ79893.1 SPOR domain-containing protein [Steroidobacteraceae bacterium]